MAKNIVGTSVPTVDDLSDSAKRPRGRPRVNPTSNGGSSRAAMIQLSLDNWKRLQHCATENLTTPTAIVNGLLSSCISRYGKLLIETRDFGKLDASPEEPEGPPVKAAGRK